MLKTIRENKGISQKKLADLSGVNIQMIQHYEQGVRDINKAQAITVLKLAKALECNMEAILNEKGISENSYIKELIRKDIKPE